MSANVPCPCGSGAAFEVCCAAVHRGERIPDTAEAVMRARYSAFATGAIDFLLESHHSRTRHRVKRRELEEWARASEWLGLEVLETSGGTAADQSGTVSFRARYRLRKDEVAHAEKAEFEREGAQWRFVDGTPITHAPVRRAEPKVGRNDPCPCGSGKKYKKCCGAVAAA